MTDIGDMYRRERELMCEVGRAMWSRQLVAANDGNLSLRLSDGLILCTPTLVSKGFLRPELLPVVDLDGVVIIPADGGLGPSSELKLHLRVYRRRSDVKAVVHAHPLHATAFAVRGEPMTALMLPESVMAMPSVPLAPYATPSTEALPDSIEPLLADHSCCLLEQHGALTWGSDLMSAYLQMERLEYTAALTHLLRQTGGLRELPPEEVTRIRQICGISY